MHPRKSLELHALNGTTPNYKTGDEPVFVGGKPKRPKDLTPEADAEWKRLVKELTKRGTLTRVDSSMLELYVRMWSRWRKVATLAEENPTTEVTWTDKNGEPHSKVIEHPASSMATKLENSLRHMLKELSATPASRNKTKPTAQPASKNAPPHPESKEGLALESARLQALVDAERAAAVTAPAPEPEIDLDSPELQKAMEEI
jgi:P27 family predicted phage terminase small subunit